MDAATDSSALPTVLLWAEETAAMAPAEIADAWEPVIALLDAVGSGGAEELTGDLNELEAAATRIREHSATACGLAITFL